MAANNKNTPTTAPTTRTALVTRSIVPSGLVYTEYRPFLRKDFYWSCAYCTRTEGEASTIRFTIDHYEPQTLSPALVNDYSNLLYCCDTCNLRKGSIYPPANALAAGVRFFRPDTDIHEDHFESAGLRINGKTKIGEFTIDNIDLNRLDLRRLRQIREKASACQEFVAHGIQALRKMRIDQLPPNVKAQAFKAIRQVERAAKEIEADLDAILKNYASSPYVIDANITAAESEERRKRLEKWNALYPGRWRPAPKKRAAK